MDLLLGFLVGLVYAPALVIIVGLLTAARLRIGVISAVVTLIMLAGPAVWAMTFVAFGVGGGLMAFAGWVVGLGLAALIFVLFVASRLKRIRRRRPYAEWR